jgi:hypothetical protein
MIRSSNQILPDRYLQTNRVDVGMLTKTGRTARFRAYDAPPHVAKRDVAQLSTCSCRRCPTPCHG